MNHTLESWALGFLADLEKAAKNCADLNLIQVGWGSNVSLIGLRKNFVHLDADDINFHFRHGLFLIIYFVSYYTFFSFYTFCLYYTFYFRRGHRRILILDYDGTLTSETDRYLPRYFFFNKSTIIEFCAEIYFCVRCFFL
jgi:hypothetical protein